MTNPAAETQTTQGASESPTPQPPSSNPSQTTKVTVPRLGVRRPTRSTTSASAAAGSTSDASDEPLPDPLDDGPESSTTRSSRAPRDGKRLNLSKKPLREAVKGGFMTAGVGLHRVLARTEAEQAEGVWLIPEDDPEDKVDADDFADPVVNLINRHTGGTVIDADAVDLFELALATLVYIGKNVYRTFQLRRAYRRAAAIGIDPPADYPQGD